MSSITKRTFMCVGSTFLLLFCIAAKGGYNPKQVDLSNASYKGQIELVKNIIRNNSSLNLSEPLLRALKGKHEDVARFLIDEGAKLNSGVIYLAAKQQDKEILDYMVESGANIDAESERTSSIVSTPLLRAVYNGEIGSVRLLLDLGANVNHISARGNTGLHQTIRFVKENKLALVKLLLQHGADPDLENDVGMSARFMTKISGDEEVARIIEVFSPGPSQPKLSEAKFTYTLEKLTLDNVASILKLNFLNDLKISANSSLYSFSQNRDIEQVTCRSMKAFEGSLQKDNFILVTGICGHGPFDKNNISTSTKLSESTLKTIMKNGRSTLEEQKKNLDGMILPVTNISATETVYTFMLVTVGHGFALLPTSVIIDNHNNTSFVVQYLGGQAKEIDLITIKELSLALYKIVKQ